jgi:hypothetical protein
MTSNRLIALSDKGGDMNRRGLILILAVGCFVVTNALMSPHVVRPAFSVVSEKEDERFFSSLERLMNRYGTDPEKWLAGNDKDTVAGYLRAVHGLEPSEVRFARNLLGLGVNHSPEQAAELQKNGVRDAWGHRYDLVMASSLGTGGKMDMFMGFAINQGVGLFNSQLADRPYVVLKADLHSQFGDVFKNFNGISMRLIAREVNLLGAPGSASEDYSSEIRPALTAADAVKATIYTCQYDKIPLIIPKAFQELAQTFGMRIPELPVAPRKAMGPMKRVPIDRIILSNCSHDLDEYKAGMKERGQTLLSSGRI